MSNELINQSQDRKGTRVIWVVIHTAEGPTDEFPANPNLDSGSAKDLLKFFQGKDDRSCHAIADDDILIDNLVPYSRAAWTLRNGNNRSDNLEMCGLASWSRQEWLTHTGMLKQAAKWVAGRLHARNLAAHRLTIQQCAAGMTGYMDHNTYTLATNDGTHWDCGPNFPWDVFNGYVSDAYNGNEDDDMAADPQILAALDRIADGVEGLYRSGFAAQTSTGAADATHEEVSVRGVNKELNGLRADLAALPQAIVDAFQAAQPQPPA